MNGLDKSKEGGLLPGILSFQLFRITQGENFWKGDTYHIIINIITQLRNDKNY